MDHMVLPWSDWEVLKQIGEGGFGTVYEIVRRDESGREEHAAIKVVSIPRDQGEIDSLRMEGYDNASIAARYREYANNINREYYLQRELRGHRNIVRVDENKIVPHEDGLGWDIYIRMELLHPMKEILGQKQSFSEEEVIRLGKDLCEALNVCHDRKIIHRDIKPDNIFLSDSGDWKLGDFGIARTMEHTTTATKAGTYAFMAPEVYNGKKYGKEVDIYSLGMVLYWLLNNRRRPFLPIDRVPKASEEEESRIKRFSGQYPLPAPLNGSAGLKRIVLKACSFDPKDRYTCVEEMYRELAEVDSGDYRVPVSAPAGRGGTGSPYDVLESAHGISDRNADYENESDATVGSVSAASGGITQGNGWDEDSSGTIGNPHSSAGGGIEREKLENEPTQRSVQIDSNEKKENEGKDTADSKDISNKPCPVGRLLTGEGLLIGSLFLTGILLSDGSLNLTNDILITVVTFLLYFGGPILAILFWKTEGGILGFSKLLIYVNIFFCFCTIAILVVVKFIDSENLIVMLLGIFWWVIGIFVSQYLGKWMLDEKLED